MSLSSKSHPCIIIGAGIGGLAAAIALRQKGVDVLVAERAEELREVGAGLLLSPNACSILDKLGALELLTATAVSTPRWDLLEPSGKLMSSLLMAKPGEYSLSTRRSDLQQALLSLVPPECIFTGKDAISARVLADHVEVQFSDGSSLCGSRVIAADGVHSAIRAEHWPKRAPRYRGYIGWRAIADHVPRGWETGRVSETWGRGRRFGIGAVGGGRTYWYASANLPQAAAHQPFSLDQLRADFQHWHNPVSELLAHTKPGAVLQHPISDTLPSLTWQKHGSLALLGDAAHPLTPNLGQGAAMAMEDAWELASQWHLPDALQRYERRRRLRLFLIWAASHWVGTMIQWEHPLLCAGRDAQLKLMPSSLTTAMMRRLLLR